MPKAQGRVSSLFKSLFFAFSAGPPAFSFTCFAVGAASSFLACMATYGLLSFKPVFQVPSASPAAFFIQIIRRLFYLFMHVHFLLLKEYFLSINCYFISIAELSRYCRTASVFRMFESSRRAILKARNSLELRAFLFFSSQHKKTITCRILLSECLWSGPQGLS